MTPSRPVSTERSLSGFVPTSYTLSNLGSSCGRYGTYGRVRGILAQAEIRCRQPVRRAGVVTRSSDAGEYGNFRQRVLRYIDYQCTVLGMYESDYK